jgi:NADPH:quinone reductase-like Zn-dependent oxidoreductase
VLALQAIRDDGQIQPGQKVLINGAGGGVGTFAVQIAKHFGAEVTAVDSVSKFDLLRTLGADHTLDYNKTDYTQTGQRYNLIVDVIAKRALLHYKRALTQNGIFSMIGGSNASILQAVTLGKWLSSRGSQKLGVLIWDPSVNNLTALAALVETGKIAPVIDRCYPLGELKAALRYLEAWHAQGKVVITMAE